MNIAVCEDNIVDQDALCGCIRSYCENNCYEHHISTFESAEDLLLAFVPGKFNIVFLDIYLHELTGIEAARRIRRLDPDCLLVMVTVSRDFALESYAVQAVSYVEKPVNQRKIDNALFMCRHEFEKSSRLIKVPAERGGIIDIPVSHIQYVEVYDKESVFHMGGNIIKTRMPLDEVELRLGGEPFLRCHRCYIVNMHYVEDVLQQDFLLKNGERVPIRKKGRMELKLIFTRFVTRGVFEV